MLLIVNEDWRFRNIWTTYNWACTRHPTQLERTNLLATFPSVYIVTNESNFLSRHDPNQSDAVSTASPKSLASFDPLNRCKSIHLRQHSTAIILITSTIRARHTSPQRSPFQFLDPQVPPFVDRLCDCNASCD